MGIPWRRRSSEQTLEHWRERAQSAEAEVRDLSAEVQRLQDIIVGLTERVAQQSELLGWAAERAGKLERSAAVDRAA